MQWPSGDASRLTLVEHPEVDYSVVPTMEEPSQPGRNGGTHLVSFLNDTNLATLLRRPDGKAA
jgi:hypothetical protein